MAAELTDRHIDVLNAAVILANQWKNRIDNNQVFEGDLWKAVDELRNKHTFNEKWLYSRRTSSVTASYC